MALPDRVILCLGLLLMICSAWRPGRPSLAAPSGLYAAIGFLDPIELATNWRAATGPWASYAQAAASALRRRCCGCAPGAATWRCSRADAEVVALVGAGGEPAFAPEESSMIERALAIGGHDVRAIMVARGEMVWPDVADTPDRTCASSPPATRLPLCAGDHLANVLGVLHFKDAAAAAGPWSHRPGGTGAKCAT